MKTSLTMRFAFYFFLFFLAFAGGESAFASDIKISYFELTKGRLAFTYIEGEKKSIQVVDFKTLEVTPLASDSGKDEFPAWSPDGRQLAFQSARSGKLAIYSINADGSDLKQLTNSGADDQEPSWSPDGKRIAFRSNRGDVAIHSLYTMNADGSAQTVLTNSRKIHSAPKWSPKGNEILFVTSENWPGTDLAVVDISTKRMATLTVGNRAHLRPAWDPTASSFVYSYGSATDLDLWTQQRAEGKGKVLISRPGKDFDPEWLDDGTRLFFAGEIEDGGGRFGLYVYNISSKEISEVVQASGSVRGISWTPHDAPEKSAEPAPTPSGDGGSSPSSPIPSPTAKQ